VLILRYWTVLAYTLAYLDATTATIFNVNTCARKVIHVLSFQYVYQIRGTRIDFLESRTERHTKTHTTFFLFTQHSWNRYQSESVRYQFLNADHKPAGATSLHHHRHQDIVVVVVVVLAVALLISCCFSI